MDYDYLRRPTPKEALEQRATLHRWTEINAMPLIYIGALLAGKIDELPKIKGHL